MYKDMYPANEGTPHNKALPGDIAKTVLMPGDPLRAKYVAEKYLSDVKEFSTVRNMFGYTGKWKGRNISVMGSGMGCPSIGIYSFELFSHYGVENIIRIGTCGGLLPEIEVGDILFAQASSTDSNFAAQYNLNGTYSACADYGLLEKGVRLAREHNFRHWVGNIFSSDIFSLYHASGSDNWKKWADMGCAGTDMESYALYCTAAYLKKKALTILTCSDSNVTLKGLNADERQTALGNMFTIGLEFAE